MPPFVTISEPVPPPLLLTVKFKPKLLARWFSATWLRKVIVPLTMLYVPWI